MSEIPYTAPKHKLTGFNCPFCNAFADQHWGRPNRRTTGGADYGSDPNFWICRCARCEKFSLWMFGKMVYPSVKAAPLPNSDLPEDVKADYEEARNIANDSPRGAAALLRLAIQKLCKHLGEKGKNINDDIASLVKKGLPEKVQQALDIVRVVGNNAVHPGQIDLNDEPAVANKLFDLVNIIAEIMITQPKHVASIYDKVLPAGQKDAIEKRDS